MKLTIIGGGPGGYTAAFEAAEKGCDVTLVERQNLGGTCLNRGCIPTKTLRASADALSLAKRLAEYGIKGQGADVDMQAVHARKESVAAVLRGGLAKTCQALKIDVLSGTAEVKSAKEVLVRANDGAETVVKGDAVIIATGSRVLEIPGLGIDHEHVLSSDDALELTNLPRRLCIVGGGVIGCEMACIFRAFGSEVTVVEGQDRLLPMPSVDKDVSALLAREMRRQKIKFMTGKTLKNIRLEDGLVRAEAGPSPFAGEGASTAETPVEADLVFVTIGRCPNTDGLGLEAAGIRTDARGWIEADENLQTSVPGVYAVGDVLGPKHVMLAHVAEHEALCAVRNILGTPGAMDYSVIPSAIFTSPEIGEVGMSEDQAKQAGFDVAVGSLQMRVLGKAQAMGELPGFFKVVCDKATGRLLGLHAAGAHASDLVAEGALALAKGATVKELAAVIHAHPTLAEGVWEAARLAESAMARQ